MNMCVQKVPNATNILQSCENGDSNTKKDEREEETKLKKKDEVKTKMKDEVKDKVIVDETKGDEKPVITASLSTDGSKEGTTDASSLSD